MLLFYINVDIHMALFWIAWPICLRNTSRPLPHLWTLTRPSSKITHIQFLISYLSHFIMFRVHFRNRVYFVTLIVRGLAFHHVREVSFQLVIQIIRMLWHKKQWKRWRLSFTDFSFQWCLVLFVSFLWYTGNFSPHAK